MRLGEFLQKLWDSYKKELDLETKKYVVWECENIGEGWKPRAFLGNLSQLMDYLKETPEDCMIVVTIPPVLYSKKAVWKELSVWNDFGKPIYFKGPEPNPR